MRPHTARPIALAFAALAAGCSASIDPGGDGTPLLDARGPDALPVADAITTFDGGPFDDTFTTFDGGPFADAITTFDGGPFDDTPFPTSDVGTVDAIGFDAPADSIVGEWRVSSWEMPSDGGTLRIASTDTPLTVGGIHYRARVSGLLFLAPDRLDLTFAIVLNDHLYVSNDMAGDASAALSTAGYTVPGTVRGTSFVVTGGMTTLDFGRNADGSITLVDAMSGARTTFERTTVGRGPVAYTASALGVPFHVMGTGGATLRAVLAWDLPGRGAGYLYASDTRTVPGPVYGYVYPVMPEAPPPMRAWAMFSGNHYAALAYVVLYDDRDHSGSFTMPDVVRGISPVAVGWRSLASTPAPPDLLASPVRTFAEGFQIVSVHTDYSTLNPTAVPFDPRSPVLPDAPFGADAEPVPLPDVL